MTEYTEGQVVKGHSPPKECPDGYYWRKAMGLEEFRLYRKKVRKAPSTSAARDGEGEESRLTVGRVAAGIRFYMQNEDGFKRVMEAADLSVKALQNLAMWTNAAATAKAEREKAKAAAVAKANAALKDAGLMIGADGSVQPILPAV